MGSSHTTNSLNDFLAEMGETLDRFSLSLAQLTREDSDLEIFHSIYRDIHSLKAAAPLFACTQLGQLAHAIESCLEPMRHGRQACDSAWIDVFYRCLDIIKKIMSSVRSTGQEPDLRAELSHIIPQLADMSSGGTHVLSKPVLLIEDAPSVAAATPVPQPEPTLERRPTMSVKPAEPTPDKDKEVRAPSDAAAGDTVRVQVNLLDSLMNLVGELVLIRNQVVQHTNRATDDAEFTKLSQRLNIVTTELQNEVMKTRMQPIGNVLTKFHRIVRDLSKELGKEIQLTLEGSETELDKTLIEAVKDPLTHIIRNSIDHGIETGRDRLAANKEAVGHILIRSFHEGGQIVIEVSDDGKGLNRARIGAKAVEKELISADTLKKMNDREVYQLIFAPGFSTAETVSNVSGRGVGMDVVRTNIEKIGGMVDLSTIESRGTTIRIKIPLTLAIVPALIVYAGHESFAIPQVKLTELVRIEKNEPKAGHAILMLQGKPVVRLRGKLLPLVSLKSLLKIGSETNAEAPEPIADVTNIAVLKAESGLFGLIVDSIEDSTDIVVKPLSAFLKNIGVFSGATVLGDGSVALVLDVVGLAARAEIFNDAAHEGKVVSDQTSNAASNEQSEFLLVDIGSPGVYALPLALVNRLEEFSPSVIELSGEQRVVRYRGSILPLISVHHALAFTEDRLKAAKPDVNVGVVVVELGGRQYGLEVRQILDVIATSATLDTAVTDRPSILGTVSHAENIVVVIDAYKVIESAFPGVRGHNLGEEQKRNTERSRFRILVAEDNGFFRKHISQILEQAGFKYSVEVNGEDAFNRLQSMEVGTVSLLLSDIEMPKMTGLQLAERVRTLAKYRHLPMIALSSKVRKIAEKEAIDAGFDRFLEKLDPQLLVAELDEILGIAKELKYGT